MDVTRSIELVIVIALFEVLVDRIFDDVGVALI
jgi:hypothetical protein